MTDMTPEQQMHQARGETHGDFEENARVTMVIRDVIKSGTGWNSLSRRRQLVLDEIAIKMGRAVSGGNEDGLLEAFTDIAGYANLGKKG